MINKTQVTLQDADMEKVRVNAPTIIEHMSKITKLLGIEPVTLTVTGNFESDKHNASVLECVWVKDDLVATYRAWNNFQSFNGIDFDLFVNYGSI